MDMKSLSLLKHERPIKTVKFNRDGDLLFTTSKDAERINVLLWNSKNGELVGNYEGHVGVVTCLDVNYNSTMIMTTGVDQTLRLWEIETGKEIIKIKLPSMLRFCRWSLSEKQILCVQDPMNDSPTCIYIFDIHDNLRIRRDPTLQLKSPAKTLKENSIKKKLGNTEWIELDTHIVSSGSDGILRKWNVKTSTIVASAKVSKSGTTSIKLARNRQLIIACSLDGTASVYLTKRFTCIKTIHVDRPVHCAALHPRYPILLLAGGQSGRDVTLTSSDEGKMEVLYYDFVYEKLIGQTKSHFGPVHNIAISNDGKRVATGGEDSYLRIRYLDEKFEKLWEGFKQN